MQNMVDKKDETPDFSEFWFKIQRDNGDIASALLFEEKKFEELYGEDALKAYIDYEHYIGNIPTNLRGMKRLRETVEIIIDAVGVHPQVIMGGRFISTRVEEA